MMGSDFYFRDKIPVIVLGATTSQGQYLVKQLIHHPWFTLLAVCDEAAIGQPYEQAINWPFNCPLPPEIAQLIIQPCQPSFPRVLVFSALHSENTLLIEQSFVEKGHFVFSTHDYLLNDQISQQLAGQEFNIQAIKNNDQHPSLIACPPVEVIKLFLILNPLIEISLKSAIKEDSHLIDDHEERIQGLQQALLKDKSSIFLEKISIIQASLSQAKDTFFIQFKNPVSSQEIIQAWSATSSQLNFTSLHFPSVSYVGENEKEQIKPPHYLEMKEKIKITHLQAVSATDYTFEVWPLSSYLLKSSIAFLNAEYLVAMGKIYW